MLLIIAEEAIKIVRHKKGEDEDAGKFQYQNAKGKMTEQNMTNPKPENRNPKQKKGKI